MEINPAQLLTLLQWLDSAFPTGAFAHSGGLETYTQADQIQTAEQLAALIAVKLHNAATTDMIVIHCALKAYTENDLARLSELDELCQASKMAKETREASTRIGRRMLDNVLALTPDRRLEAYRAAVGAGRCFGHHAVVHGVACAAAGVDAQAALLTFGAALVANQTSAALKLMPFGPAQAQRVIHQLHPAVEQAVELALTLTLDDFGAFAPALDIRAMQHEHLFRRLFIS